ncbi:ABC transporter permease [Patescibacteria group bacterium]|nr:ABC transporter permease [Patescibacteria group bacterium]
MKKILTVWKKELIDTIRDRRTLGVAIVMPIVMMPLIMVGSIKLQESQIKSAEEKTAVVAFANSQVAPEIIEYFSSQGKIEVIKDISDGQQAILDGEIDIFISLPEDYQANITNNQPAKVTIYEKSTEYDSDVAFRKISTLFIAYNNLVGNQKLIEAGLDPEILRNIEITKEDLASSAERGGFILGLLLPMFLVMFSIIGGMYMAIDISAGEKERKTIEALLLVPLSRLQIVTGKFLAVATTSITTVVLSILSMYASFKIWPPDFGGSMSGLEFNLSGSTIMIMIGIGALLSIMFAALLLAVAIFAKSYKEAQNYVMPLYLLVVLPVSLLNSLPGFKPPLPFFYIPAVNAVMVFKEILMDQFISSHVIATFISLLVFSVVSIMVAAKIYSKESILFRD